MTTLKRSFMTPADACSIQPVGVYDSGVGGITVLRALREALPREHFVYVADSGHAPYGDRTQQFLDDRAHQVARFFVQQRAKALVLACNTVSVAAARSLRAAHAIPIVAMEPAIKPAARITRSRVVLVLATTTTVRSDAVTSLCQRFGDNVQIILQACPGLAERVERGEFGTPATQELLQTYVGPGLKAGADTIVLGCTHYGFLAGEIARLAGAGVTVIEPSAAVAQELVRRLNASSTPHRRTNLTTVFYTSGDTQHLRSFLALVGEPHARVRALPSDA